MGAGFWGRAGERSDVFESVELAFKGNVLLFQKETDTSHSFVKARPAFVHRTLQTLKFMRQECPGEPAVQPAIGDCVQHTNLSSHLQWMVECRHERLGNQPGSAGALGSGGQEYVWCRTVATVGLKVVFNGTDMGISQFVAKTTQV